MAINTLDAIRTKVRRLTRKPSEQLLSTNDLDNYINTFVLYDIPEHFRTFNLLTNFTFYTNPFQDTYRTDEKSFAGARNNPLYNFQNKYITISQPVYIAGFEALYTQSQQEFFGIYPKVNNISSIGVTGDDVETRFAGVINSQQAFVPNNLNLVVSLLPRNVLFSSIDEEGIGLAMVDVPVIDPFTGQQMPFGNLYRPNNLPADPPIAKDDDNFINYITGEYVVDFDDAPGIGQGIYSQTVAQSPARPQALMYYNNTFTVRPVPDQPYSVEFQAFMRPTEMLASDQKPELEQWWQYIAYGAAKKIFEDQMDTDSVAQIMPEFEKQGLLCQRPTLVQNATQRTATIYVNQQYGNGNGYGNNFGGLNF